MHITVKAKNAVTRATLKWRLSMLKIEHISKSYKKRLILNDISYQFDNMIYVLVGENGAGKTTLLRCITGIIRKYSGSVVIGENGAGNKTRIGYVPQNFGTYYNLSVQETLEYIAILKEVTNVNETVEKKLAILHMEDIRDQKVKTLSGGMIRRIGIAQALLDEPEILVMDEPTVGLDPKERKEFFKYLMEMDFSGTIIISTHILDDAVQVADKVLLLTHGKLLELSWVKGDSDLEEKYLCALKEI